MRVVSVVCGVCARCVFVGRIALFRLQMACSASSTLHTRTPQRNKTNRRQAIIGDKARRRSGERQRQAQARERHRILEENASDLLGVQARALRRRSLDTPNTTL